MSDNTVELVVLHRWQATKGPALVVAPAAIAGEPGLDINDPRVSLFAIGKGDRNPLVGGVYSTAGKADDDGKLVRLVTKGMRFVRDANSPNATAWRIADRTFDQDQARERAMAKLKAKPDIQVELDALAQVFAGLSFKHSAAFMSALHEELSSRADTIRRERRRKGR